MNIGAGIDRNRRTGYPVSVFIGRVSSEPSGFDLSLFNSSPRIDYNRVGGLTPVFSHFIWFITIEALPKQSLLLPTRRLLSSCQIGKKHLPAGEER